MTQYQNLKIVNKMDDTKRIIIAFGIIFLILILWQYLFRPTSPVSSVPPESEKKSEEVIKPETIKQATPPTAKIQKLIDSTLPETTTVLENPKLRLTFSNRGGVIKSVWLKEHNAELVPEGSSFFANSLLANNKELDLSDLMMTTKLVDSTIEYEGKFQLNELENRVIKFKKIWRLNQDYTLNLSLQVDGATDGLTLRIDDGLTVTEPNVSDDLAHFRFYCKAGKTINGYTARKLKNGINRTDKLDWVGLRSKYFLLNLIGLNVKFDNVSAKVLSNNRIALTAGIKSIPNETKFLVFLGPLKYDLLKGYNLGLENTIELGWPKPFSYAILKILGFLFRIFGNYGVALVIFSILMKVIFWPLTRSSTKQMRQMQLLQPKLEELKKRYKNDPQALNRETMQLYKLYKINPLSGCLPLIIQLPIFWALYSVLRSTIDLRRANFVFWLKDLSLKDPLYILPILMGGSFLAQNLLTSADKRNMALTVFMPLFLTVIFLNFPSGLQLYWFIYNILSIAESLVARKGGIRWQKLLPVDKPLTS
ncbi:MAG: membrane protein insertase YidC [candidate division WOR-3 bacterium]